MDNGYSNNRGPAVSSTCWIYSEEMQQQPIFGVFTNLKGHDARHMSDSNVPKL